MDIESSNKYDWIGFIINFIFAAIPTWLVVGMLVWKYSPFTEGVSVLIISTVSSIVVGIIAGIYRNGFWLGALKLGKYSPYYKKPKK